MPNWAFNDLIITGEAADIEAFQTLAAGDDDMGQPCALDFVKHAPVAPTPEGEHDPSNSLLVSRQVDAWGTKWRLAGDEIQVDGTPQDGTVTYSFSTAWSPPTTWLARAGALHDALRFELVWAEGGMGIAGQSVWEEGELVCEEGYDGEEAIAFITGKGRRDWLVWEEEGEEATGDDAQEAQPDV